MVSFVFGVVWVLENVFDFFVIFVFILFMLCCGVLLFGLRTILWLIRVRIIVYCVLFGLVVLVCVVDLFCLAPWVYFLGGRLVGLVFC